MWFSSWPSTISGCKMDLIKQVPSMSLNWMFYCQMLTTCRILNLFYFLFRSMITVSENHTSSHGSGYGYAIALFFVVLSQTLLHQLYQRNNMLTAVKIKTAVVGLIYKKVIRSFDFLSQQKFKISTQCLKIMYLAVWSEPKTLQTSDRLTDWLCILTIVCLRIWNFSSVSTVWL